MAEGQRTLTPRQGVKVPELSYTLRDLASLRLGKLRALYNHPRFSDITLVPALDGKGPLSPRAGDGPEEARALRRFHAVRAILAGWSPVFESILFPPEDEKPLGKTFASAGGNLSEVRLDVDGWTLELFLTYAYGGEITVKLMDLWPLYCFLNTYQVTDLIDQVEDLLEQSVSVDTCCALLASAQKHGTYDHYALRKCLNLLLMDFPEVAATPGFLTLDYTVLDAVVGSDELNAQEDVVFNSCMRWVEADETRTEGYLDALLERIRLPLLDPKLVAGLDAHPIAGRSAKLPKLMLTALKFAVSPGEVSTVGLEAFRPRKGGLYWRETKNNVCMDLSHDGFRTFVCSSSCDLVRDWRLHVDLFDEGSVVVGIAEETADSDHYIGRFTDGWGLADNGHFYHGGCKCPVTVTALCTPICEAHVPIEHGGVVELELTPENDLVFRVGPRRFLQRIQRRENARVYPAVSVRRAKVRIFSGEAELFE